MPASRVGDTQPWHTLFSPGRCDSADSGFGYAPTATGRSGDLIPAEAISTPVVVGFLQGFEIAVSP